MKRLIIVGAGGMGREVLQCAKQLNKIHNRWNIAGFLDPDPNALEGKKCDVKIIGDDFSYEIQPEDEFVCAIGDGHLREKIMCKLEARGAQFVSIIHPTAIIADNAEIGKGSIIFAGSIISDNAVLGTGSFMNFRSSVGHDVTVGNYATLFAGCTICGECIIGDYVTIGTASTVVPRVKIGNEAYVCAGSAVMRNIRDNMRVIGVPAGPMKIGR